MRIKRKNGLKVAAITIALLLCLALAVGITGAFYQAKRQAIGTLSMDQGIIIDYKGFGKTPDEGIWTRENKTTFLLFDETNAQPGQNIPVNAAGIRANEESVNFYARVKLSYKFYNGEALLYDSNATTGNVEGFKPSDLITTSANFFGTNWVDGGGTDGYYYYATGTTLNKFEKGTQTFVDLFAADAKFVIEGEGFTLENGDLEGGGFVVGETSINKIEVFLTLETLQGDATAEQAKALGWKIAAPVRFAEATGKMETSVNKTETTEDLNVSVAGATEVPINKVVFPYDKDTTLKFDSNNVEYITLTYDKGEPDIFDAKNYEVAENTFKVNAKSSKGSVTGYVVGLWSNSEYNDLIFTDKYSMIKISGEITGEYIIKNGIAVSGYLGTDSSITILSKASVRNRDFKIVLEYDGKEEEYAGEGGLYGPQLSELRIKIMSILGGLCFPCNITDKTGKIKETINSQEEFLNWITPVIITGDVNSVKEFWAKYPETMTISYSTFVKASGVFAKEKNILEIAPMAFLRNEYVTDVVISEGITKIGVQAFDADYLDGIKSVTLPASLEIIDDGAFWHCTGLTSITIPDSVKSIGEYAFSNCSGLTSINIPDNVTSIGNDAFRDCRGLTSVTIPDSVTSIGSWAFYGCSGLTTITIEAINPPTLGYSYAIPDGVQTIYVPAESVETYKNADGWKYFADQIQAIA